MVSHNIVNPGKNHLKSDRPIHKPKYATKTLVFFERSAQIVVVTQSTYFLCYFGPFFVNRCIRGRIRDTLGGEVKIDESQYQGIFLWVITSNKILNTIQSILQKVLAPLCLYKYTAILNILI